MDEVDLRTRFEANPRIDQFISQNIDYDEGSDDIITEDDETLFRNFQAYEQETDRARIAEQLQKISSISSEIDEAIRQYIQNLKYPKALIGDFKTGPKPVQKIIQC